MARMGTLATGLAGGMLAEGARQWAQGKRPSARDLLLTPANARRVADQLAQLRGAAMKVGQLLSMDAGELLPRIATNRDFFECRFCPWAMRCWSLSS